MTDAELAQSADAALVIETRIRRHLAVETGAFEYDRGMAAYRGTVALRRALEQWIATRAKRPRQE